MAFTGTQVDVRAQDYSKIILPLARQEKSMLYDKVFIKNGFVDTQTLKKRLPFLGSL